MTEHIKIKTPPLLLTALAGVITLLPVRPACAEGTAERPVVAAAKVIRGEMAQDAAFQAELRPYQEIELHAKVTGYLDNIKVDAGDIVKEGQVLAVLDVPELKTDIDHALASERRSKAETARAQAAYEDAHLAYTRIVAADTAKPNLIAQQDIDAAKAKDRAAAAALDAAKEQEKVSAAEVKKLQIMEDYTKITAPFNGVVTKRYADTGALIQAGTSGGSQPLVRLSQNDRLRAVFPVSSSFVARIKEGDPVDLQIPSLNKTIPGKVARFSRKVDTSTRTMDVEVDVANDKLTLIPGIYATAQVKIDRHPEALSVPIEAVAREKSGVATLFVIGKDHLIQERQVKTGLESASRVEILDGVQDGDVVLLGSRAQVKPGEAVEPKIVESQVEKAGGRVAQSEGTH